MRAGLFGVTKEFRCYLCWCAARDNDGCGDKGKLCVLRPGASCEEFECEVGRDVETTHDDPLGKLDELLRVYLRVESLDLTSQGCVLSER